MVKTSLIMIIFTSKRHKNFTKIKLKFRGKVAIPRSVTKES